MLYFYYLIAYLGMDETGSIASGGMMVDDQSNIVSEEDELQKAIQMSLQALENMPEPSPISPKGILYEYGQQQNARPFGTRNIWLLEFYLSDIRMVKNARQCTLLYCIFAYFLYAMYNSKTAVKRF